MEVITRGSMTEPKPNSGSQPSRQELERLLRDISEKNISGKKDGDAARRLIDLYSRRLYGLAYRILSDRQAAEDTVQDVFLALLEGKARFQGRGHPEAFLLRVTSFLAIDQGKKNQRRKGKEDALMEMQPAGSGTAPVLDSVLRRELEGELSGLLKELTPEVRAALALKFWQGATVREIAGILSTTRSTASRWIDGALEKLRRPLLRKGFGAGVAVSMMGDLLGKMQVPPPSPGFRGRLEQAVKDQPRLPHLPFPPIPEPVRWGLSGSSLGIAAAVAVGVTAVVALSISLLTPGSPEDPAANLTGREGGVVLEATLTTEGNSPTRAPGGGASANRTVQKETALLEGQVLDPDRRPVRRALVRLFPGEGRFPADYFFMTYLQDRPLAEVTTNRLGGFRFGSLSGGSYRILAKAPGLAPGTSGLLRIGEGDELRRIRIRLPRGGDAPGMARLESGEPVEGVRVEAAIPIALGTTRHGFWLEKAVSGKDGRFTISGVGQQAAELLISADRHQVVQPAKYARSGGEPIEILLSEGQLLSGKVVDPDGSPVAGAEVLAFSPRVRNGRRDSRAPCLLVRKAKSDGEGKFHLPGLASQEHALFARHENFATSGPSWMAPSAKGSFQDSTTLKLLRGERIEGRLIYEGKPFGPATGYALPGPLTSTVEPDEERIPFIMSMYAADSFSNVVNTVRFDVDGEGRFTTPPLARGDYILWAYRDLSQYFQWFHANPVSPGEEPPRPRTCRAGQKGVEVVLPRRSPLLFVAGTVVDEKGQGIANVQVECSSIFEGGGSSGFHAFTDQRGVFEVESYDRDRSQQYLALSARTPDGREAALEKISLKEKAKLRDLRIVIDSGIAIAGTVRTAAGLPVMDASVKLEQDGHDPFPRTEPRQIQTDGQGRFRFESPKADRLYSLSVEAEGWARAELGEIEVGTPDADFVLSPEAVLRGRVVDLEGRPVENFSMGIMRYTDRSSSSSTVDHKSDGSGIFSIRGLEAGEYSVYAYERTSSEGRRPMSRTSEKVTVSEGDIVEGIVLVMTRLVALTGKVVDEGTGRPIPGATVADWDPESRHFPDSRFRVETEQDGQFRKEGLPRGTILIYAVAPGYLKCKEQVEISGETDEECLVKLTPAKSLVLIVRDQNGRSVSGAYVHSHIVWPPPPGGIRTDSEGRAELPVPAAGLDLKKDSSNAQIEIQKEGYAPGRLELTPEIIERGLVEVTLKGAGRIVGVVTDHLGEPIPGVQIMARRMRHGHGNRTDDRGTYSISSLEPGEYEVSASSQESILPKLETKAVVAVGRDVQVDFRYPDPATLQFYPVRLVATYEDGRPAGGARIRVSEGRIGVRGGVEPLPVFSENELEFGADGTLEVLFEEPGVDELYFYGGFQRDGDEFQLVKTRGKVVSGQVSVTFRRIPLGEITIRVRDASTGRPISGYDYFCKTEDGGGSGSRCRSPSGEVETRAGAGEVTVTVTADGYKKSEKVVQLPDRGQRTVEFQLLPGEE